MGQRFSACFLFEIAPQRGEGEKREGNCRYQIKEHRTFDPRIILSPVLYNKMSDVMSIPRQASILIMSFSFASSPFKVVYDRKAFFTMWP